MNSRPETGGNSYPDPSAGQTETNSTPFYGQASAAHQQRDSTPPSPTTDQQHAADLAQLRSIQSSLASHEHHPQYQPAHSLYDGPTPTLGQSLREASAQQSLAQGVLSIGDQHHGQASTYGTPATDSARKRSKVSRACDECRRKKIRCDAGVDPDTEPCTNCRKSGVMCRFSRMPMKRGPSKGYIKELSDRLNALESQQAQQQQHGTAEYHGHARPATAVMRAQGGSTGGRHTESDVLHPPSADSSGPRKRTHSASEHPSTPQHENGRQSGETARHHPRPGSSSHSGLYHLGESGSLADLQAPSSPSMRLRDALNGATQRSNANETVGSESLEPESLHLREWDEEVIDEYYRIVHQTFPLLPHSKSRLRQRLASCSHTLREAFFIALDSAMRTYPGTFLRSPNDIASATRRAAELIATSQFEIASTLSLAHNLVYIQTLILMALLSDNFGPATMRGEMGPPRGEWIGRAIGMATHLKLNCIRSRDRIGEGDPDADEKLGRRVWWILFILDRWHSSSTSSLLQVPETATTLDPEDQILFGDNMYHLARLSFILGHLSAILQQPASLMAPGSEAGPIITITILGEIDRFRESVESLLLGAPTLVHLSYWHVRLLVLRLTSSTSPHELLTPATRTASILNSSSTVITPLNHHFAALSALTLVELCGFEETRRGAQRGIEDIAAALGGRKGFISRENSTGWDGAIRELITRKSQESEERGAAAAAAPAAPAAGGLQHLADAAVGGKSSSGGKQQGGGGGGMFDATTMTRQGYLTALVHSSRSVV